MPVSIPKSVRWTALLGIVLGTALALAGCAAPYQSTSHVVVKHAAYPIFPAYTGVRVVENQTYERVGGGSAQLDLCLPPDANSTPRPAILAIHGGSWARGSKTMGGFRAVCEWLASSGYVAASLNYRLAPKDVYPDAFTDVSAAIEWLRSPIQASRFSIDPSKIGVFGASAGGNLAALLGTAGEGPLTSGHRVAAVAELSGPSDLTASGSELPSFVPSVDSYLGCTSLASCPDAREASPLYHVDPSDPPFFIANSTDELIPLSQSANLVAALRKAGDSVRFVEVRGDAHAIEMLNRAMRIRIINFFRATLGTPKHQVTTVAGP